jgi:RNA-directed DNA polymerase
MQVSYGEGVATHTGPELCVVSREAGDEALVGVRAGRVLSPESNVDWGADAVGISGRPHPVHRQREMGGDPTGSQTSRMHGNTSRANREIPGSPARWQATGRSGKSENTRR